jgi:hypothetical protein
MNTERGGGVNKTQSKWWGANQENCARKSLDMRSGFYDGLGRYIDDSHDR